MKSSLSFIFGLLVGLFCACLAFAFLGQRSDDKGKNIVVAHGLPTDHPVHKGITEFARKLEELSGGTMKATVYPNELLGKETVCLEKTQQGEIDITKVSCAPVGNFVPVFKLFSLPYLFRDRDHYWEVLDGEIGGDLLNALSQQEDGSSSRLIGLNYFDAGSRSFYANTALTGADSLSGLKIRVMEDPVAEATVKALGGSAVTMPFGELFGMLQQGGVDGAENNAPSYFSSSHYESCKNYLLDEHSRIPDVFVAGEKFWEGLDSTQRQWVREAAAHSSQFQRKVWEEESLKALEELKNKGVTVRKADIASFQELTKGVVSEFATGERLDYVNRIKEVE